MDNSGDDLIGIGLYSFSEAAKLTGVPSRTIRRWVLGYQYSVSEQVRNSPPVWLGFHPQVDGVMGVGFLDLIEARLVQALRSERVPWRTIREAARRLRQDFQTDYPFASKKLLTDGRDIFIKLGNELLDVARSQFAFRRVFAPYLKDVVFDDGVAALWYPDFPKRSIIVDPKRRFGRPITARSGIPTYVLSKAAAAEGSAEAAARWYGVSVSEVEAAVAFEDRIAA